MIINISKPSGTVTVDGVSYDLDLRMLDWDVFEVDWNGQSGTVKKNDGLTITEVAITDITPYQIVLDGWNHANNMITSMRQKLTDYQASKKALREIRNSILNEVLWMQQRHEMQLKTEGTTPTLTDAQYQELLLYIQALRDIPQKYTSLNDVVWPNKPSFV